MYYVARWYDPYLNRFIQPDTIVPDPSDPMAWDRYAYTLNNPLKYTDPTGHAICGGSQHPCPQNPVNFEPIDLWSTGIRLIDGVIDFAVTVACGYVGGWCKAENSQLIPTTDEEYFANGFNTFVMAVGQFSSFTRPIQQGLIGILDNANPADGNCDVCAQAVKNLIGDSAEIVRFNSPTHNLTAMINGKEVLISSGRGANPSFHEFVQVGDMVYDALTGSKGMTTKEYFETFFYHLKYDGIHSFEEMIAKR